MADNDGWGVFEDEPASATPEKDTPVESAAAPEEAAVEQPVTAPSEKESLPGDTALFAGEDDPDAAAIANQYLVCDDGHQTYAISVRSVKEITVARKLQCLPKKKPNILGVMALRGQLIPMVDTSRVFQETPEELARKTEEGRQCVVICDVGGRDFGIYVHSANKVMEISAEALRQVSVAAGSANQAHSMVNRISTEDGNPILLLELENLLQRPDKAA